jgi:hypothetical protein
VSDENTTEQTGNDLGLDAFYDQASARIRYVIHEGEPWYSVIDMVALLTDAPVPRVYWGKLKERLQDEGFREVLSRIRQLKLPAPDGKQRLTDCANRETLADIRRYIPATLPWRVKRDEKPQDMLYIIGPRDGGMVKIGISAYVARRLQQHQSGSPVPLVILWQTPGGPELERWLHLAFAHRRAHGEWFDFRNTNAVAAIEAAVKERAV